MKPRIAFVSREVYPFGGGGLGASVAAAAAALADVAEVTIFTTDLHQEKHSELVAATDPRLPQGVKILFVPEPTPDESVGYFSPFHLWSARIYTALKVAYPGGGPDLVEFPDFHAEAAVTVQARRTLDPALRHTTVAVRAYTSHEMCEVLNGYVSSDMTLRNVHDLERYALKYADAFLWPGGDILNTYHRFYGEHGVARPRLVRHIVVEERAGSGEELPSVDEKLRFIYVGRLERRKGIGNLMRAVTSLERDDWSLTILGGDTLSAPLGVSMQDQLKLMAADDERIQFHPPVDRDAMFDLLERHHVAVFPSLWECWPFVALHAFDQNRPVLATPVGGFVEMVEEGVSGWLAEGTDAHAVGEAFERVLNDRASIADRIRAGEPRKALQRLSHPDEVRRQYLELMPERRRQRPLARTRPLVTAVVPYHHLDEYVGETVASLFDQTHTPLEVLVVNDGSFRNEDLVLAELATAYPLTVLTQENAGLGAARNFGIRQARGRYVFPLDADNLATPTFVERAVDALESDSTLAYVTAWSLYINAEGQANFRPERGYQPVSNDMKELPTLNSAGDAAAVIRRRIFDRGFWYSVDATSYEDWLFYRRLAQAGLHGHVIPERLLLYRIRETSMMRTIGLRHHGRLMGEMEAELREQDLQWTS